MKLTKFRILALAAAAVLSLPALAVPTPTSITFDPTGTPGAAGNIGGVGVFDWAPGSALAANANTATGLVAGSSFTTYFQANLGIVQNSGGGTLYTSGSDGNFFTAVSGFGESISSCTGAPCTGAVFSFDGTNATNFFRIYRVGALANNLTGAGFTGAAVLSGHVIAQGFGSNFTVTGGPTLLDANGNGDQWAGTQTLRGVGSSDITVQIDAVNANYFPDLLAGSLLSLSVFTTQQVLPYNAPDPSRCMATLGGDCLENSDIGAVNGAPVAALGGGVDVLFQTDANQSFLVERSVPEPASLGLMGLGLIGLFAAGRRRSRKA